MYKEDAFNIISTFIVNGFHIEKVERLSPENSVYCIYKYDKLGAKVYYSILFSEDEQLIFEKQFNVISKQYRAKPILVCDNISSDHFDCYSKKKFFDFFGGMVTTGLILIQNLPEILEDLGYNKLPPNLSGKPDDLHEIYVKECLQFILESPTRRYGEDRLFESLPDGIVIGKNRYLLLMDSKSYSGGFSFKADDIKRFASYVEDFNSRYGHFFGNVFSFLVISGHFNDSDAAIQGRSDELYKLCGCRLSCIKSKELGYIVQKIQNNPDLSKAILWKNVFTELMIMEKHVNKEIARIKKDKLF